MKAEIIKTGINGEGIAYSDDHTPIFVPQALVGEIADIEIVDKQKRYMHGKVKRILKKSAKRVQPMCRIQARCGGCPLMIAGYDAQLDAKQSVLRQSLIKYAQINPKLIQPIIPSENEFGYRNQCKLPCSMVDGRLTAGMYMANSNYFEAVEHCVVHEQSLERIRAEMVDVLNRFSLRAYDYHSKRGIRTIIIRGFDGEYQACIVSGEDALSEECIAALMNIKGLVSLWQSYHTVKKTADMFGKKMIHLGGAKQLHIKFDDLSLRLSPRSFFQLNTQQAQRLYRTVAGMVGDDNGLIVEAYSGIGAISLYLKDKAKEIIGIEEVKDAVVNANENAAANGAGHVSFLCADAADKLTYLSKKRQIDTLVVDPPRSGLDDAMLYCILKSKIKRIVYVSCNPATLGKNLAVLRERYEVKAIQPIDMFPQTQHVESVVLMSRVEK